MTFYDIVSMTGSPSSVVNEVLETRAAAEAKFAELHAKYGDRMDALKCEIVVHSVVPSRWFTTEAPDSYDGFGTRTIMKLSDGRRIVDVQDRHADWQMGMYYSGLYRMDRFEGDDASAEDLEAAAAIIDRMIEEAQ